MVMLESSKQARTSAVFGWLVHIIARTGSARIRDILLRIRRLWLRLDEPNFIYQMNGIPCLLPGSHALPVYQGLFPQYDTLMSRLVAFLKGRKPKPLVVVDIGANVGDTAMPVLAEEGTFLVAVEGEAQYLPFLRHNLSAFTDRSYIVDRFVGKSSGVRYKTVVQAGTARLERADEDAAAHDDSLFVGLDGALTEAGVERLDLLKVDTDGFDTKILRESEPVLRAHLPVILFEFDPALFAKVGEDGWDVFAYLNSIGYQGLLVYRNTGEFLIEYPKIDDQVEADLKLAIGNDGIVYVDIVAYAGEDALAEFDK